MLRSFSKKIKNCHVHLIKIGREALRGSLKLIKVPKINENRENLNRWKLIMSVNMS
jgi:hypothetical protein